jgi:hypothetical protein
MSGSDPQEVGHFSPCPLHCYKEREKGILDAVKKSRKVAQKKTY